MNSKRAKIMVSLDDRIKSQEVLIQELQSKVARQRNSLAEKDEQIRQLRTDKAMLLAELRVARGEE